MKKSFLTAGALLAAVAVIGGAFGAHYLKTKLPAESLQTFETGVRYQFYHALALLAAGMLYKEFPGKLVQWAGYLFIGGIILFSGSLYILCAAPSMKWVGPVTPLGGLCFILGWLLLAYAFTKKN
ncbi:DUF423 domain-containing protein [Ferruginibacter sp. SUN106]|uniref:DUF423 domain-containing protein n=1 Tax=Ferruginibacter sp. SUN106 TaxID=2978348 RepID=UPI003D364793